MMPAAKMFDPIVGVDVHIIQPPGPVPPVPIPHPHTGMLFDPMDFAPFIGATVKVNGIPRAVAGSGTKMIPPHIPIGGVFVKPPANDSELFMGSMTVSADGEPFGYLALPLLSCWDIGMPPFPRAKRSPITSMVLPTTVVLSIPSGVMVGGPPIPSLTAIADRLGLGPLMALYEFATTGNPLALLGLAGPLLKGLKFLNRKFKIVKKSKCGRGAKFFNGKLSIGGDPVDIVTGAQFDEADDYVEPGGLLAFSRYYNSSRSDRLGTLGHGFTHSYEAAIDLFPQVWRFRDHTDVEIDFDPLTAERKEAALSGFRLRRVGPTELAVERSGAPTLHFEVRPGKRCARLVRAVEREGVVELSYEGDRVSGLTERRKGSPPVRFTLRYDERGFLAALVREQGGGPETVVRYSVDAYRGLLSAAENGERLVTRYQYDAGRRMVGRTDPGGYAFTWAYDAQGRCVSTRGADGLWASTFEYHAEDGTTIVGQDGAQWIYRYDENGRITARSAPDGEVLTREIDGAGNVLREHERGQVTTWLYDSTGVHTGRKDALGNVFPPDLDAPYLPDPLAARWPETPVEREHGVRPPVRTGGPTRLASRMPNTLARTVESMFTGTEPVRAYERFDRLGRLIERGDEVGRVRRWVYAHGTVAVAFQDADGKQKRRELRRAALVTAEMDGLGNRTGYAYDAQERVASITDPLGSTTAYSYDPIGRLVGITRDGSLEETHRYGLLEAPAETEGAAGPLVTTLYDDRGLPKRRSLTRGGQQDLAYDAWGNVTRASTELHEVLLERDERGRLLADLVDGFGVRHSCGRTHRETNLLGRFSVTVEPVRYGLRITDPTGRRHELRRDARGNVLREHPWGTRQLSRYDDRGACLGRVTSRGAAAHVVRYHRTREGDLVRCDDSETGTTTYTIDDAHRLVGSQGPGGPEVYTLDPGGNLLAMPGLQGVKVGTGNRLVHVNGEEVLYDARFHVCERRSSGGGTIRYGYDSLGMLVEIEDGGAPWSAHYDAWARRLGCGRGALQTAYYWDGQRLAAEISPTGAVRLYLYGRPSAMLPFAFVDYDTVDADADRGRVYAVFYDQVGMPTWIEDENGSIVWRPLRASPYGALILPADRTLDYALRWPGHYCDDEHALHYNRYRYYVPAWGRYLQSDPIGQSGGINVYAYPANPLVDVDVLGLAKKGKGGCGGGGKKGGGKQASSPGGKGADGPSKKRGDHVFANGAKKAPSELRKKADASSLPQAQKDRINQAADEMDEALSDPSVSKTVDKGPTPEGGDAQSRDFGDKLQDTRQKEDKFIKDAETASDAPTPENKEKLQQSADDLNKSWDDMLKSAEDPEAAALTKPKDVEAGRAALDKTRESMSDMTKDVIDGIFPPGGP